MIAAANGQATFGTKPVSRRDYISFSAINTFQRCPLRYYFKYVEGIPERIISVNLVFGGAFHAAAEHHYNALMIGGELPDRDELLGVFWDNWRDRSLDATVLFGKRDDINSIGLMADRMLECFVASDIARPSGAVIGVEEQLRGELVPGIPDLLARIDLIVDSKDTLTITDLKTARSRWTQQQADNSGEQLMIYGELARSLVPDKPVHLEFAVITKAKQPTAERFTVTTNPQRLKRTKQIVQRVWQSIEDKNYFPNPSPMNCPTCPFQKQCRQWCG